MVGSSKILTVSYGTFSCTLEGFDDSFDTMKAIAEYFRDLAADDRYFGAEPPTPDAEMLARIAEKEIARRVEARMEGAAVVLRPAAALAAAQAEAPAPQQSAPQAVAEPVAEPVAAPVAAAAESLAEPEAVVEADPEPTPEPVAEVVVEEVVAETVDEAEPAAPAPVMPPPVQARAHTDSVAAKLQRIRAVVGKAAQPEYIEDIPEASAEEDIDLSSVIEAVEAASEEQAAAEQAAEVEASEPEQTVAAPEAEAPAPVADQPAEEPVQAERPQRRARVIRVKRAEFDRAVSQGMIEQVADKEDADTTNVAKTEDHVEEAVVEAVSVQSADIHDAPAFLAARVEEDDEDDTFDLAALDGLEDLEVAADLPANDTLSDEDEEDLLRELASLDEDEDEDTATEDHNAFLDLDSDDEDEDIDLDALDDDMPAIPAGVRGRDLLSRQPAEEEADMSRILDRTDEQLRSPDIDLRRRNLSHLKAAVAATEAARRMGEPDAEAAEGAQRDRFRADLTDAVRPVRPARPEGTVQPQRPAAGERRSERPRPAPLKLVASQRIDVPTTQEAAAAPAAMPVRPRRIATTEVSPEARAATSFSDFAETVGAHSLAELLEAAAAYTSFVEGLDDFSRPQVMKKVREVLNEPDFSREDGLRVFGTLLREGRISKVRNGRFQVSDQTRFRPEPRAARG